MTQTNGSGAMMLGFAKEDTVRARRIIFHKHIETRGWGGEMVRNSVDLNTCARIEIDIRYRLVRMTPLREKESFECPLEAVQQWFRIEEPQPMEKITKGPVRNPWGRQGKPKSDTETSTDSQKEEE